MEIKVKAVIQSISGVTETSTGGKWLTFRAKTVEEYSQVIEVKIYKKKEYAEHADKFVQYNKVGDTVDLELKIQSSLHEESGRMFTNLNLWKCTKLEVTAAPLPTPPPVAASNDDDSPPF
ncbi:MAG: hypothetical protein COA36_16850 [Desulfotalea sp.]|nr:MAG: hypothetical protein COA36_16850 [Desulfotalea sp.]